MENGSMRFVSANKVSLKLLRICQRLSRIKMVEGFVLSFLKNFLLQWIYLKVAKKIHPLPVFHTRTHDLYRIGFPVLSWVIQLKTPHVCRNPLVNKILAIVRNLVAVWISMK